MCSLELRFSPHGLNANQNCRKYLDFAIQFTPQYGDSFIEYMRLELLLLVQTIREGEDVKIEALISTYLFFDEKSILL